MNIVILFGLIAFAALSAAVFTILRRKHIRRTQEKVYRAYLREQAILEQNFFSTYFTMLREAQRHKGG